MKKYVLFPHGGSGNHGCEAIVRTTSDFLLDENKVLFSSRISEDIKYGVDKIINIKSPTKDINKKSNQFLKAYLKYKLLNQKDAIDSLYYEPVISELDKNTILLSIGGDNYCYGENEYIYMVNRYAKIRGAKTVLWGCSVELDDISSEMKDDLKTYDLIVARESLSYEALRKINCHTILKHDPAFSMKPSAVDLPTAFNKTVIGINISPLIVSKESIEGITLQNYVHLIKHILSETDYSVALIPHVVWNINDDRLVLIELKSLFSDNDRVIMINDYTAPELKYIISHCEVFVGARTHATIAAYSTCVPTLVVGYSIKARGIARDIFGTEDNYVVPVQSLQNEDDLLMAYKYISNNSNKIKAHLQHIMPSYIQSAYEAAEILLGEEW